MNVLIAIMSLVISSASIPNIGIVEQFCKDNYSNCEVVYFTDWNDEVMNNRANTNKIYVEIEKSVSSGEIDEANGRYWGYIEGSNYYRTWYNTEVEKNKIVTSYYIYNPYNNYEDDIVAVIDNEMIR